MNTHMARTVVGFLGLLLLTGPPATARGALVAYWSFDDGTGTQLTDHSGRDNHGTLAGTLELPAWVPGRTGCDGDYALSFSGSGSTSNSANHPHVFLGNLSDLTITGSQTILMWLHPTSFETRQNPYAKAYGGTGTITQENSSGETASISYYHGSAGANNQPYQGFGSSPVRLGQWNHVAVVRDYTENELRWYLNGVCTGTGSITVTTETDSLPAYIGRGYTTNYRGMIDDMAIWNEALDAARVMSIDSLPSTLGLPYDLDNMLSLWSIYDVGPGGAGTVNQTPWQYTDELPDTPPNPGGAYISGGNIYLVLGDGDGLMSPPITWDGGGGANKNWSLDANWNPDGPPVYTTVFDNTATAAVGTVTNVVDTDFSIGSLVYQHTSSAHTMQIDEEATLQLTGVGATDALVVNGLINNVTTRAVVIGAGKIVVDAPSKDILLTGGSQASGTSTAALDMSGLAEFEATVNEFRVGTGHNRYAAQATLAATNTIVADAVVVGANTYTGTSHFMRLGETNAIHADKIIVAGARSTADLQYDPSLSGMLTTTIRGKAGGDSRAAMWVADQAGNGGYGSGGSSRAVGRVDFTGGTLDAQFSTLIVGRNGWVASSQPGGATATFGFDTGTLDATNIIVGLSPLPSSSGLSAYNYPEEGETLGTLNMGGGTLLAGSMTLGETQGVDTPVNTYGLDRSTQAHGTFNLSGGTATVLGNLTLAHHTSTGTALATGTINIIGGNLEVQGNLVEGAGGDISESTVNVLAGSLNVDGDLMVDTLRVGREGTGAVTTGSGSHVAIGSATSPTPLYVGVRDYNDGTAPVGVLDMSQSATFTAHLTDFDVGVRTGGSSAGMRGTVKLAADNEVHADRLLIGAAPSSGNTGPTQLVELGDTNVFHVGTLTVADSKSKANLTFRSAGSTLELGGNGTARANLRIGYNNAGTGAATIGIFDASGSTFNALLQDLAIGYHREPYTTGGEGKGTLTVDQGTIDAVTVTLGNAGIKSSNDAEGKGDGTLNIGDTAEFIAQQIRLGIGTTRSEGTINFTNGALTAGSITHGIGSYDFNWTGGTLQVAEFGDSDYDFDLVQSNDDATSILAPGTSIGTTEIFGNYTMEDNNPLNLNVLAIEIAGRGTPGVDYDQVIVHGDAVLGGQLLIDLLGGYDPRLGHSFDILTVGGTISGELTLAGDSPSEYYWEHAVFDLPGGGQVLRLSSIPEPTTFILLLLGAVGFLAQRVPKRVRR